MGWWGFAARGARGTARDAATQLFVVCALTALVGGALQTHKLASLDAAGREFGRTSTSAKTAFLVPFALAKSCANLVVGALADAKGRRRTTIVGWCVACIAPVLGLIAGGARDGYAIVTASAFFLGSAQGLTWTALVLASVDVCGKARRGFASGLNETIGYSAIALFAEIYGSIERASVRCGWNAASRSGACAAKNVAGVCATADDWVKQCVGECVCEGYMRGPMGLELAMCLIGLVVSIFVLRESSRLGSTVFTRGRFSWANEISEDQDKLRAGEVETSDGGSLQVISSPKESLKEAMIRTTWRNKSTRVVCIAAFCANFETAVAWGLMSVWARDSLGLTGRERDFFTACYSFMKGFTQIASGTLSDTFGRRWPIAAGLMGGAASLLIAAFGAGFHGRFSIGGTGENELKAMQLAYLTLSSTALGFCTGMTYPVLAAAAVDHAPDPRHYASTLGVMRFWRDLGYVMGVPIAAIADAGSAELAFILVAASMFAAGYAVQRVYDEATPGRDDADVQAQGYATAATTEPPTSASEIEMSSATL